ncbi:MAG: RNA polymerase sigma factor [Anaerolineales bacterium]
MRRARQGEPAAWEELVRLHQEAAFRLAYLILGDAAEAEDSVQEAFVRAFGSLARFDETRPFRPWLMRIAANHARNRRRSMARYWARLQRMARRDPEMVQGAPPPRPAGSAETLWQAVRRLGNGDQEVIYLRYFLGLTEAEAAEVMHVPAGTVKSRLHRSLARLRQMVTRDYPSLREALDE